MSPYVATPFVSSSPEAEVHGSALVGLLENLLLEDIRPLLQKYGLETVDINRWYPQQLILDFDKAIHDDKVKAVESLMAIGMKLIDGLPLDPTTGTVEQAIADLDRIARSVQRNIPQEEGFSVAETRPGYALVISNTPFPDDLVFGYLWATVRRYRPSHATFKIHKVENRVADQYPGTAFEIMWG